MRFWLSLLAALALLTASAAQAAPIQCCSVSSDATPASQLEATFDFSVVGTTLTLTVDNDTLAPNEFNINEIFFDASDAVTSLVLMSATHSVAGDVLAGWDPVETAQMADGFMPAFDFALLDGVGGMNANVIGPGENIVFEMTIGGVGPFTMADFGWRVGAKFVNGPDDPENPGMEDSAYGTVPEPTTGALLGLGLAGLASARRRR